ncbi:PA2169 family four-helix-bundle protein [Chryseobacterium sp. Y16C]|uniref:PA2169 family four-helix-bundle protein n=1 Tax=Chryseobacterium sp. Y16C TaxID=2920939 RepID=UPI001F0AA7AB|nr:PA2169 family four-helix-bundle protein [Chryseobacterium sp. Y16C]UMQ43088.1 PA2169 family four-helix-bundle protein [Chryseobacterium sp. Y16C]
MRIGYLEKQIGMENHKIIEVLNDLIEINNDRAEGFEKAIRDINAENIDLKAAFEKFASQSRSNITELAGLVGSKGEVPEDGNTVLGTLHRAWIDIKATFGGSDLHSILEECERGEDAIKKAYKDALQENELGEDVREVLLKQQGGIQASHDAVKALRDLSK